MVKEYERTFQQTNAEGENVGEPYTLPIFYKAPLVEPGDEIVSSQMNQLAEAWNSRIAQGIGDCWWQIAFMAESFVSQIRQHQDQNISAPRHEWLKEYAYVKPGDKNVDISLHVSDSSETAPGGMFPGNPLAAWFAGNTFRSGHLDSWMPGEYDRLYTQGRQYRNEAGEVVEPEGDEILANEGYRTTDKSENSVWYAMPENAFSAVSVGEQGDSDELWHNLARKQRGLTTGYIGPGEGAPQNFEYHKSPFAIASTLHFMMVPNHGTKIGVTYGGWTPNPRQVGSITVDVTRFYPGEEDRTIWFPFPIYELCFKSLVDGVEDEVKRVCEALSVDDKEFIHSNDSGRAETIDFSAVRQTPSGWYAFEVGGKLKFYSRDEWVLAQNGLAELKHHPDPLFGQGRMFLWDLIFTKYCAEFKGTPAEQESARWNIKKTSVDWQKMGTRQSLLAPARARLIRRGDQKTEADREVVDLVEVRTFFETSFDEEAKEVDFTISPDKSSEWVNDAKGFEIVRTETSHTIAKGFTLVGVLIKGSGLEQATIEVNSTEQDSPAVLKFKSGTDGKINENGSLDALHYFLRDRQGDISIKLIEGKAKEGERAELSIELIELRQRKMSVQEFYVFTRLSDGGRKTEGIENRGDTQPESKLFSDDYFRYGCVVSRLGQAANVDKIHHNAIYETARQLINGYYKMLHRELFEGYEIIREGEEQKSVFYFNRRTKTIQRLLGGKEDRDGELNAFDAMGPSVIPVEAAEGTADNPTLVDGVVPRGPIVEGQSYIVQSPSSASAKIEYNGEKYSHNDIFTGVKGETNFFNVDPGSPSPSSPMVYEYESIRPNAPPNGFSNEWVMGLSFCPYDGGITERATETSSGELENTSRDYKPSAYADLLGSLLNPAHLFSKELGENDDGAYEYRTIINGASPSQTSLLDLRGQVSIAHRSPNGVNRPQFYSRGVIRLHEARSPSRLNFAKSSNGAQINGGGDKNARIERHEDHYKSMQMYRDPYRIESITPLDTEGNFSKNIVRVKLHRRLDGVTDDKGNPHLRAVPGEISWNNESQWSTGAGSKATLEGKLRGSGRHEPYSTDDNRILKYAMLKKDGAMHFPLWLGDVSSSAWIENDNLPHHGNYLPFFHCVKLIEKVYEDDNVATDKHDTYTRKHPFLHMAFCAPMCEGFIDRLATSQQQCPIAGGRYVDLHDGGPPIFVQYSGEDTINDIDAPAIFEYSIERCCAEAFRGSAFAFLPKDTRDGHPAPGAGPMPSTTMYAEIFNQYARFVNQLEYAKVDLPLALETRVKYTRGIKVEEEGATLNEDGFYEWFGIPSDYDDGTRDVSPGGLYWDYDEDTYKENTSGKNITIRTGFTEDDWFDVNANGAVFYANRGGAMVAYDTGNYDSEGNLVPEIHIIGSQSVQEFRIKADQHALHAVPKVFRTMETTGIYMRVGERLRTAGAYTYRCDFYSGGIVEAPVQQKEATFTSSIHYNLGDWRRQLGQSTRESPDVAFTESVYEVVGGARGIGDGNFFLKVRVVNQ